MTCRSRKASGPYATRHMGFTRILSAAIMTAFLAGAAAPRAPVNTSTENRLVGLAKLWGFVKYHHPELADRPDIDWDAALVAAIPNVRGARTGKDYRDALQGMLRVLEDPMTRMEDSPGPPPLAAPASEGDSHPRWRMTEDGFLVLQIHDYYSLTDEASRSTLQRAAEAAEKAKGVILDIRSSTPADPYGRLSLAAALETVDRLITAKPLSVPGLRRRIFYGYPDPSPFSSGQYRTGFFTRFGSPLRPKRGSKDVPSVVLLNELSAVPETALARQAAGLGLIVFAGDPDRVAAAGETRDVDLGEGLVGRVRVSEPVYADGTSAILKPDRVIGAEKKGSRDEALEAALDLVRAFLPSSVKRHILPASADLPAERAYAESEYPSREFRLLALFRFWNTIHFFYPYKHLLDRDWESVLHEFLPKFDQAADAIAYSTAIAEMAVRLQDNHAYVAGNVYSGKLIGNGYPPIRVRIVEGRPVVAAIFDPSAAGGVEVGDVVLRVDGEEAGLRLSRYSSLISGSTPQNLADKSALVFMNGPSGSAVKLVLRDRSDRIKEATLARRGEDYTTLYHRERTGEIVRLLPGGIGYVDLDRLSLDGVDGMFEKLRTTKAIVFDMRGYPNGTIWAIAPRLASKTVRAALLETPLVGHDSPAPASEAFYQTVEPSPSGVRNYWGRTVMLMDERTVSQAEHTGLYLKAANGTVFVGSPTAGADGEIVALRLPGAVTVGFTGQSVRHPDGRELQRVGLVPDVTARPTIRGMREGRDEVLEAALRYLESGQRQPVP